LQGAGLSWAVSGVHDMLSAPAKPTAKIWGAACASQGPLDAAHGAIHRLARQNEIRFRSNKIALFCFCVGMAAELISLCEDYFQST
jgi:hypothetical protein